MIRTSLKSDIYKNHKLKNRKIVEISIFLVIIGIFCISGVPFTFFPNNELDNETKENEENNTKQLFNKKLMEPHSSAGDRIWNVTWGGNSSREFGGSVWGDGTYLYSTTSSDIFNEGNYDLIVLKWDKNGTLIWNASWGGLDWEDGISIWGDGTYLYVAGATGSFGDYSGDLLLTKWDLNGSMIWSAIWGGTEYDYGYSVFGDGVYIYTVGGTESFGASDGDLFLIKWDPNGNRVWNTTWGGTGYDYGNSIWCDDNTIYTCGMTNSFGAGQADLFLVKWDPNGNQIWNTTWGGSDSEVGNSVWGDGTYLYTTGSTNGFGVSSSALFLVKWDVNKNQIWNTTWDTSGYDIGYSIWGDGKYIYTAGYTDNPSTQIQSILCVKWSLSGTQIFNCTFGSSYIEDYYVYSVWGDGMYIYVGGWIDQKAYPPDWDIYLAKFNVYTEPYVTSPQDITYLVGSTGKNISWTATDSYILTPQYIIYRNGIINKTGSWSSGIPLILNLDPYATGVFNYTIIVFDGYGGKMQDQVMVTVTSDLYISQLPDSTFPEHQTGNILSWTVTDSATLISPTYEIFKNDTSVVNGTWITSSPISYNMYDYTAGIYNITIKVNDGWGEIVSDEVITIITKEVITDNSISVTGLSNYTYEFNSTNNNISWTPMTNGTFSLYTYTIYRNATAIVSGSWRSGSPITINIDDLLGGTYNYTIVITGDDIIAQNTTMVTVTGGPSAIGNGGIPGYNIPLITFIIIGFIACISLVVRKKMQMN